MTVIYQILDLDNLHPFDHFLPDNIRKTRGEERREKKEYKKMTGRREGKTDTKVKGIQKSSKANDKETK